MRMALLIVGFSLAAELPASAWNGVFVGMERYDIPAVTVGMARLLAAFGVIAAALTGHSLVVMAIAMAAANLVSYLAQYIALRRLAPDIRFHASMVRRSTARELYGYCLGLTVFAFSTFLVTGLDLILVGRFQFSMVTAYSCQRQHDHVDRRSARRGHQRDPAALGGLACAAEIGGAGRSGHFLRHGSACSC